MPRRRRAGRRAPRRAAPVPAARLHLPRHRIDPRDPGRRRARRDPRAGIVLHASGLAGADAPECAGLPGGGATAASGAPRLGRARPLAPERLTRTVTPRRCAPSPWPFAGASRVQAGPAAGSGTTAPSAKRDGSANGSSPARGGRRRVVVSVAGGGYTFLSPVTERGPLGTSAQSFGGARPPLLERLVWGARDRLRRKGRRARGPWRAAGSPTPCGRFRHDGAVGEARRLGERELPRLAAGAAVSWCPSPAVDILFYHR